MSSNVTINFIINYKVNYLNILSYRLNQQHDNFGMFYIYDMKFMLSHVVQAAFQKISDKPHNT